MLPLFVQEQTNTTLPLASGAFQNKQLEFVFETGLN